MTEMKQMRDDAKKALYAAVGAPFAVGKKVSERITDRFAEVNTKVIDLREKLTKDARDEFEAWAAEGEQIIQKLQDRSMVEDLTGRVDVDQFQEQVGKLRTQLEDMVESWRSNFLPEDEVAAKPAAKKPAAKTTAAKKPAAKTTAARTTAAKKPAAKTTASKTTASKTTAAKKPAAKTTAARTTAAKKPAAKPAAKKPAAKSTAAKKPAAKTTASK